LRSEAGNKHAFLTRFATARDQGSPVPGRYSDAIGVWTISTDAGEVPIIEMNPDLIEITTKTKVEQESDDTAASLLEIQIKTSKTVESDDDARSYATRGLLEVTTKTEAQMESDDTSPRIHGFL
jgi:hypothetical protein